MGFEYVQLNATIIIEPTFLNTNIFITYFFAGYTIQLFVL